MLGQEIPTLDDELTKECALVARHLGVVMNAEYEIDEGEDLYLTTWALQNDPEKMDMPDADFNTQHHFNVNILSDYLDYCQCGLFCVESTQTGAPHYHGWYQLSRDGKKEAMRICIVKVLQRMGNLKITKSKGHYKLASWSDKANCLYYYKKDLLERQLYTVRNPITRGMQMNIDWNEHYSLFTRKGRQSVSDIEDRINLTQFYKEFYKNSL